jgi:two-component system, sensor histidine kinase PdtaS
MASSYDKNKQLMNTRRLLYWFCFFYLGTAAALSAQAAPASRPELDTLLRQANKLSIAGKRDSAMLLLMEVIRMAEGEQLPKHLGPAYQQIGFLLHFQGDNDKALEYLRKAAHIAAPERDTFVLSRAWLMTGLLEFMAGRADTALALIQQAADLCKARGDLAYRALALSKIGNIHEAQGNYQAATPYFKELMETAAQADDPGLLMTAHINLASNAYNLERYAEALSSVDTALEMAAELGRDFEYQEMLQLRSLILEKLGRPSDALQALRQYVEHHDSIINIERNRQIAELELQYETEKKESRILQQDQELRLSRLRSWALGIGLLAALGIGGLLYRLTRQLRKRNEEKEFLIKEIHHRVKNNLQVLSSLLHLQSRHIKDESALDAVREGQNRVEAMGLIHQKLYMGDKLASVEMKDYLYNLGDTLLDSFGLDDDRVKIIYHLEPLQLDVDTAIPLGLIVNELVTNSLKYAFPDSRQGTVEITLRQNERGKLCLKVADNGVGLAGAPVLKNSTSFGSNLVEMLSKKLKGKPEVSHENGYATLIEMEQFKIA